MEYISRYQSPLGAIVITEKDNCLSGLWFEGQRHSTAIEADYLSQNSTPLFAQTSRWLDIYFSGKNPDFCPPLKLTGTPFQNAVWSLLKDIPYGKTVTYKFLAENTAKALGLSRMSAQAVGGAVSKNKISIILPCHRVIGTSGNLTGYAGGLDRKLSLLQLEGISTDNLFLPK